MEKFPEIEDVLHDIIVPNYMDETQKLPMRVQNKLNEEEYKLSDEYRLKIHEFYETHYDEITGEYTANIEELRKLLEKMHKDYVHSIVELRKK